MFKKEGFKSTVFDAVGDIFFARQLEVIQKQVYEFQYPTLKSFQLIPVSFDIPEGAEYVTATQFQAVGRARIIQSYADDLPEAGLIGTQLTNPVQGIGTSYRYSYQEIRAARQNNMNLPLRLAEAARRANDQLVDNLAFYGSPSFGMTGLFNNPNVPTLTVPADGIGGNTEWTTKTPDQILRDMNLVVNQVVTQSNEIEMPDTLLLPLDQYTYIASTARSINSDTTILNYFLMNNPFITTVEALPKLAQQGAGGSNIMIAYEKNANKLEMMIPLPFTQHPPQERNLEFVIPCESRFGGVSIYYPLSIIIGEGI